MLLTEEQIKANRLWQKYLRSGDYKQTTNQLVREVKKVKKYCCWGIDCLVIRGYTLNENTSVETYEDMGNKTINNGSVPLDSAIIVYGIGPFSYSIPNKWGGEDFVKPAQFLAEANDGSFVIGNMEFKKHSFIDIADWLEDYIQCAIIEDEVEREMEIELLNGINESINNMERRIVRDKVLNGGSF